jgi:hypothetical protein
MQRCDVDAPQTPATVRIRHDTYVDILLLYFGLLVAWPTAAGAGTYQALATEAADLL